MNDGTQMQRILALSFLIYAKINTTVFTELNVGINLPNIIFIICDLCKKVPLIISIYEAVKNSQQVIRRPLPLPP
jgi:hypothetical protein